MAKPKLQLAPPTPAPVKPARTFRYRTAATHDDASAFRRRQQARLRLAARQARKAAS